MLTENLSLIRRTSQKRAPAIKVQARKQGPSHKPQPSPARTQRPVETSHTVHVLPILRLLLLPHPIHIIARNLLILRRLESREAHGLTQLGHLSLLIVVAVAIRVPIYLHGVGCLLRRGAPGCFSGGLCSAAVDLGLFVWVVAGLAGAGTSWW